MKKIHQTILSLILIINVLFSPFSLLNIKEKSVYLFNANEFSKVKIKVDSLIIDKGTTSHMTGKSNILFYDIYYNDGRKIEFKDASDALIHSKAELFRTKHALNYMETNNDSLLIWHHPNINGKYALGDEKVINTEGYSTQIIINSILLAVALYSIIWQIKEWRKPKKKGK